jgi:hypothetical protein
MNRNSIQEYIYWLERFGEIYKKYIDSSKELNEIFAGTLEKFQRILRENIVNTEENIIKSLKELVRKFSAAYDANRNINKTLEGPRSTDAFKQAIYKNEIAELKKLYNAKKIGICNKAGIHPPKGFTPASLNNFICSIAKPCWSSPNFFLISSSSGFNTFILALLKKLE